SGSVALVGHPTDGFQFFVDSRTNFSFTEAALGYDGLVLRSRSSLPDGQLKVLSQGVVPSSYGNVNASASAFMIDTIRATGSVSGSNLNLGVSIHGNTRASAPSGNANFLLIGFYGVGHLDSSERGLRDFYDPQYRLWGAAYAFGDEANQSPNLSVYNYAVSGWYPDGHHVAPLNIPFAALGSNFEIHLLLVTQQSGSSVLLNSWDNDFFNTVGIRLSADPGVTLFSASGSLPGTLSDVPEPGAFGVVLAGVAALLWMRRKVAA
ncbi:MAG: hypothetical protein MUF01_16240, partial [Bryobacterales bacterium]|nr:hypothetical protein [Bryobacterales bacterium]